MLLCSNKVLRFFRKLRSAVVVIPLPERSKCSRWTFWLRFSMVLMLLLARDSQVSRFTSCNPTYSSANPTSNIEIMVLGASP